MSLALFSEDPNFYGEGTLTHEEAEDVAELETATACLSTGGSEGDLP